MARISLILLAAFLATTAACSNRSGVSNEQASEKSKMETIKSPQGAVYSVERVGSLKAADLPTNSDLKMADNDLAKYAQTLCSLDVPVNTAPQRCDIYVQPDKTGTLIGYAAVTQEKQGISLQTAATLNAEKASSGTGCAVYGKLYDGQNQIKNASTDFEARIEYSAWEKEPGNWLVSEQGPNDTADDNPSAALGVWYVAKKGDKLHINQERWNYCYPTNTDVNMDDVFYRAMTLKRT